MKIKAGVIGFGLSGRYFHSPFLRENPDYEITCVSTSRAEAVAAFLPGAKCVASSEELIRDPNVELVINTGPNSVHFSLSKMALEAGKHVVVEKPFVNSLAEAQELIQIAKKQKRILTVFQNRRWDADFLTVQRLMREGRFGKIFNFESNFDFYKPALRPGAWREDAGPGSGTWLDLGAHLVDQMLVLFGRPSEVTADIFCQRAGAKAEDYFHVIFKYGEARAIVRSSLFGAVLPRFRIYGEKATYLKTGMDPQEPQLRSGMEPSAKGFGIEAEEQWGSLVSPVEKTTQKIPSEPGAFLEFYRILAERIRAGAAEGPIPLQDSLELMEILELAQKSAAEGRTLLLR